jgi:type IV pilus assembly protein PilO
VDKFLEQFAKIPFQFKVLALVGSLTVIVGGNYFVIILEKQRAIEDYTSQIDSTEQELGTLRKEASDKEKKEKTITSLKKQLAAAEERLPKKAEIPQLLRDIEYEAEQSGLTFEEFTPLKESRVGDFAHVPVTMNVKGSYHEFAIFLDRLAKMPRIVNATGLSLKSPLVEDKEIVMQGSFLATTYRYLDENERGSGGKKKGNKGKRGRKRSK